MAKSAVPNLARLLHRRVAVEVCGCVFKGLLTGYDGFMNIVLSEISEPCDAGDTAVVRGEFIENIAPVEGES